MGGLFPSSLWFPCSPKDSSKGTPGQEMEEGQPDRAGQLQAIDFERDQMKEARWVSSALAPSASGGSEGGQESGNAELSYLPPCV